ncbi:MAG: hypothetical protein ABEJ06_00015 [Haloarculaceae archaeon]
METPSARALLRWAAGLSVLALLAVLVWYLPAPGYATSRLVLFALIGSSAVVGAVGVYTARLRVALVGVVCLFLLGFWQAVLSVFVLPVCALLLLAALVEP